MGTTPEKFPFKEPTVLVLGAGASQPYGFSLGYQLVDVISGMLDRENRMSSFLAAFKNGGQPMNKFETLNTELKGFQSDLKYSGYPSVDRFLEDPSFAFHTELGLAVTYHVLRSYEGNADHQLPLQHRRYDLYREIIDQLRAGPGLFDNRQLTILTFNYDRSLEQYLTRAFAVLWLCTLEEAWRTLSAQIEIVHLYGALDEIDPWKPVGGVYGQRAAQQTLRIIGQARDEDPVFKTAQERLAEAKVVAFIGFGFDRTNMRRLGLDGPGNWLDTTPFVIPLFHGIGVVDRWTERYAEVLAPHLSGSDSWGYRRENRVTTATDAVALAARMSAQGHLA